MREATGGLDSDDLYADPLDLFGHRLAITQVQNDEGFAGIADLERQDMQQIFLL